VKEYDVFIPLYYKEHLKKELKQQEILIIER